MADNLTSVTAALHEATTKFTEADAAYHKISATRTAAVNALNDAQKKFDAVVAEMRKTAPRDSDWNRQKGIAA
jgi:hypothetical protein